MSARILASLTDERRHQRKQSGCINGIFQLFDHHQLLAGRRAGIHNHKRLLTGAQHQLEPLNAKNAVKAKHQEQQPKEKARWSTESPRTSYSSSSCSSKFSERSIQTTAVREQPQSQMNGPQSSDIRDVVKDSMYRDTSLQSIKSITNDARKVNVMKHIDSPRPRFSYDGRELREETTMKLKELPRLSLESKLNFLQRMEKDISSKPESHTRSSSIVAKLMGLDDFPDASPSPRVTFLSKSPRKAEEIKQNQGSQESVATLASRRLHNADSVGKPIKSSKMVEEASESTPHSSASVYGEIEKRITELEFKGSGKDLRALKQILGAMQKTKERMENQSGVPSKPSQEDRKTYQKVLIINDAHPSMSTNVLEKDKISRSSSTHLQRIQSQDSRYQANREKTEDLKPRNSKKKEPSREKITCRKKETEKGSQNRKHRGKSIALQLSEESGSCHCSTASARSESNKRVLPQIEAVAVRSVNLIKTNCREQQNSDSKSNDRTSAVGLEVTILEQPSPVSVLDATFYSEDSPSPINKKSTVFQDEAEWHIENLNHSTECREPDSSHKYNQRPENMSHLLHAPRLFQSKPHEIAGEHIQYANHIQIQDHRYINKILLASGLLQDASIIPTANQLLSTRHLINPNMFHALEETEEANENLTENNDQVRSNQKIQRKIVFDVVNEILLHKIMSGTLFTMARKRTSPLRLVKEVYLQMDNLCRTSYCSTDDEDDGFTRLLSEDMKYQADGWTEYSGEIPALVLDIERLIFKELINEVVMGEFVALRDWPNRQCRQLFSK